MKAALLRAPRSLEIVDAPEPVPAADQVVVQVAACSICGSDLTSYRGLSARTRMPTILGHEVAGTVVALGGSAPRELLGQRVVVEPNVCCGRCEWCVAGLPNICPSYRVLGESKDLPGGLAERVAVAHDQVYRLPEHVSADEGAVVQPLAISYHAVARRARVRPGQTVLILGAGPIGLGALMFAKEAGARVVVADVIADRLEAARRLGAQATIRADTEDVAATVRELTDGRGADVTFEAVGGAQRSTITAAVEATATRGSIVIVGTFTKDPQPFPAHALYDREQTMMGSHGHPGSFGATLDLVARRRIRPADLITHTIPLAQIDRAFALLDSRAEGVIKVVIRP